MRVVTTIFTVSLFAGSVLLFLLEPMIGRLVLPELGGAPAVWNTCLVFFQVTLLLGYLYAWAVTRWLSLRSQLILHVGLLVAAFVVLPIRINPSWLPPAESNPIPWLLGVLGLSIGLPFFVVSTTAPVLQHWFSNTEHPDAHDPYFLYRASNLGSMIGLLGYPFVVEPWLGVKAQGIAWSAGYVAFVGLALACAAELWKHPIVQRGRAGTAKPAEAPEEPTGRRRESRIPNPVPPWPQLARWIALSAVPASLLLGVTTALSTDVAVVPLLWVVPLLLYLFTFVLAFAPKPWIPTRVLTVALPLLVLPLLLAITLRTTDPPWAIVPLHLVGFTIVALLCHQQLAEERPPASLLTLFYLCLAVGGAIGGLFNALAAPLIFRMPFEYPLALAAAGLLKPYRYASRTSARASAADFWLPALVGLGAFGALELFGREGSSFGKLAIPIGLALPVFVCYVFSARPIRLGLSMAAFVVATMLQPDPTGQLVDVERSFFGVHRVAVDTSNQLRLLFHGNTLHGAQSLDPAKAREPQTYYTRSGPAGQLFEALAGKAGQSVGVVGLGTGALAAYAQPGQSWTFYEIDPVVVHLARDAGYFSFLKDAAVPVRVVVGDARLSLASERDRSFDLLVLDAFSSDAVPVHLLTREAVRLYLSKLKPDGVLAFHASSRLLRLRQLVLALGNDARLVHLLQQDRRRERVTSWSGWTPSDWVVLAREHDELGTLTTDGRWGRIEEPAARVWTDDYSNLLALFRWR
jgi:SAM-dependent methyltransferase